MPRFVISAATVPITNVLLRGGTNALDSVSLNKAAITQVIAPEPQQALVIDASFIPKNGAHTYGLERFWNSRHRRSEKGLEVLLLAWLDITDTCAYGLSVEQTPPKRQDL